MRSVLGRDGTGIAEGLTARGRGTRGITGKILIIDENMRTVGTDEAGHVRIQTVGQEGHFDARARDELTLAVSHVLSLCGGRIRERGVGELQRFGFQRPAQLGRAGRRRRLGVGQRDTGRRFRSLGTTARMNDPVGHHRLHVASSGHLLDFRRRHPCRERVDGAERGDLAAAHGLQTTDDRTLRVGHRRRAGRHGTP